MAKSMVEVEHSELEEAFVYLDGLRESGATNMFGAAPWLQSEFGWEKTKSREILQMWMKSFDESLEMDERIEKALK